MSKIYHLYDYPPLIVASQPIWLHPEDSSNTASSELSHEYLLEGVRVVFKRCIYTKKCIARFKKSGNVPMVWRFYGNTIREILMWWLVCINFFGSWQEKLPITDIGAKKCLLYQNKPSVIFTIMLFGPTDE